MNRYFIGYLIEGDAARYYKELTTDLSARFGIKNLSLRTPPHFTLVSPFETTDIAPAVALLEDIAQKEHPTPFALDGFDFFQREGGGGVVYLTVSLNEKLQEQAERIIVNLSDIQGSRRPAQPLVLHASVARFLSPEEIRKVEAYLMVRAKPYFPLVFSNLALFQYGDDGWRVERTFRFSA